MEIRRCVWISVSVLLLAVNGAELTRNRPKSAAELDNHEGRRDRTLVTEDEDEWASSGDDDLQDEDEEQEPFDEDEDEGSGFTEPDESEEENVDDDEFGPSGDVPVDVPPTTTTSSPTSLTTCLKQRNAKQTSNFKGYRPQCTKTGAFEPMQCYKATKECWCVDSEGNQIGEQYRAPQMPECHPDSGPRRPDGTQSAPSDDFTIIETSTRPNSHMQTPKGEYNQKAPEIEPLPAKNWFDYLLRNPLILAAAIGGSVLILVMIVLMLMFCIYRMRKKDEGSYSLDEPRQTFNYTRAKDQEFFA